MPSSDRRAANTHEPRPHQRHGPAGLSRDLTRSLDRDVLTFDVDGTVLLHRDAGAAAFDDNFIAGIDHEILANLARLVLTDLGSEVLADVQSLVFANVGGAVVPDCRRSVCPDARRLALAVGLRLVQTHR